MTTFSIASDIHLESKYNFRLSNTDNSDILILAGDICVIAELIRAYPNDAQQSKIDDIMEFFKQCCAEWKDVIYVFGNHESFHDDVGIIHETAREIFHELKNLHILENESLVINGIPFICATLWTDLNKNDPITLLTVQSKMNDYKCISNSNKLVERQDARGILVPGKLLPIDTIEMHTASLDYFNKVLPTTDKCVIVTHHQPSHASINEQYKRDKLLNGAYYSELSDFILAHPQIKYWIAGHVHHRYEYMIGTTKVCINPVGYPKENIDQFVLKTYQI